jgi:hypothetical protein
VVGVEADCEPPIAVRESAEVINCCSRASGHFEVIHEKPNESASLYLLLVHLMNNYKNRYAKASRDYPADRGMILIALAQQDWR